MLIGNTDYKISVLILMMEPEIEVTQSTIEVLLETLEDGVSVNLLLNGARRPDIKELLSGFSAINYYESEKNLGVAGGRNFLLETTECQMSDLIMILDNDVVPPLDYVRNLATFLVDTPDAGVVGAMTVDIRFGLNYKGLRFYGHQGIFGNKIFKIRCTDLKKSLLPNLTSRDFFHIGMHPNYRYAYFSLKPGIYAGLNRFARSLGLGFEFDPFLKNNARYLTAIENGSRKLRVSSVAGCSQAFRTSLIREIGLLNDKFNPYGFEDVDFCLRAIKAGYTNFIDANTLLYHGTDTRHADRDDDIMLSNQYRCRTILAYLSLNRPIKYKAVILKLIYGGLLIEAPFFRKRAWLRFRAKYDGFKRGLEAIS